MNPAACTILGLTPGGRDRPELARPLPPLARGRQPLPEGGVPDARGLPRGPGVLRGRRGALDERPPADPGRVRRDADPEGRPGGGGGRQLPRHHRAQADGEGDPPPELPRRQRAGPHQGRLLARAAGRLRLVQLLRAGGAHLRRPSEPRPPLPPRRVGRARQGGRRGRGQGHHGELRRRGGGDDPRLRLHLRLQAARGRPGRLDPRPGARGEGRERQAHRHVRRHPGHQRLQAAGDGADREPGTWRRRPPGPRPTSSPT